VSGLSFPSCAKKWRDNEFVMTKGRDRSKSLRAFLEVCLRIIQELEEVRGFSCSEASYSRVICQGGTCEQVVGTGLLFQSRSNKYGII